MPGTGNLGSELRLVRSWILEENPTATSLNQHSSLMPTEKSNSYSSSKKRLFTAKGTVIERHSLPKCREQLIAVDSV